MSLGVEDMGGFKRLLTCRAPSVFNITRLGFVLYLFLLTFELNL
jgi:hypothetical protein